MARPRKERIIADLKRFRDELVEALKSCKPEEFDRWSGEDLQSTLADLEKIRQETLQFLGRCTDADLEKTHKVSPDRELETEEIFRLVARHEYYHLGQIIYNRWQLGYNPYKTEQAAPPQAKK